MFNAGAIRAALTLNISQFTRGLRQARREVDLTARQLRYAFSRSYRDIDRTTNSTRQLYSSLNEVNRIVSGILISQSFYQGAQAIRDATGALIGFMGNMEKAQIAMEYFLDTPEQAAGFIENMKDFAATTAFSTEQALELSRRMMGANFEPESLRHVIGILNDASAATGATAQQMDRIVLAITQMRTNGKIAGQELRQFAEAGIPIYDILSEKLGIAKEQLMRIGDLKIDGDLGVMAMLQGLEERYKGAASRIANTLPGMMETIRDDLLILGEAMFSGPYASLKGFITKIRDSLESARDIFTKQGLGGVFEAFVPEELQNGVRLIVASFKSLIESAKRLHSVLGPSFALLFKSLITAMAAILPVIANVIEFISKIAKAATQAAPVIKVLIAAIMGLLIANVAAKAVAILWMIIRRGFVVGAVAQAVNMLTAAIRALFLVVTRNPIVGVIMLIAGALLSLAMSSRTVTTWLDAVMKKLGQLLGFSVDQVLIPEDKEMDEWMDQFNKQLEGINDDLTDTGKEAEKAGKKVKDKFLASFDEVFQVPEKLDELQDSLGGIGGKIDPIPPIPPPPDIELPDFEGGGKISDPIILPPPIIPPIPPIRIPVIKPAPISITVIPPLPVIIPVILPRPIRIPIIQPPPIRIPVLVMVPSLQPILAALRELRASFSSTFATAKTAIMEWMPSIDAVLTKLKGINEWVPSITSLLSGVAFKQPFTEWAPAIQDVLDKLKGIADIVPVIDGILAGSLLSHALPEWAPSLDEIASGFNRVMNALKELVPSVDELLGAMSALQIVLPGVSPLLEAIKFSIANVQAAMDAFRVDGFAGVFSVVTTAWSEAFSVLQANVATWLSKLEGFWDKHGKTVLLIVEIALTVLLTVFTGGLGGVLTAAGRWLPKLLNVFTKIGPGITKAISGMASWFSKAWDKIPGNASKIVSSIVGAFAKLPDKIFTAIKSIPQKVMSIFSKIKLPSFSTLADGVKASFQSIGNVAGFASGGIIAKDSIVRVGERGKREAIIPLQNGSAMQPFADAVASQLLDRLGPSSAPAQQPGSNVDGGATPNILYVGTLIADDRSLKELERRMKVVRLGEERRGVK